MPHDLEIIFRLVLASILGGFIGLEREIHGREALETFLKMKKMDILPYDTAPVMKLYNNYLKEDRISGTPTCVIIGPKGKQNLQGKSQVMKGLRDLGK